MQRAIVLAPNHADGDLRVCRANAALAQVVDWVDVHWDAGYVGHRRVSALPRGRGEDHYVTPRPGWLRRALLARDPFVAEVRERIVSGDVVVVHASGIEGLLLCRAARRLNPRARIIFDYHDSIPFELAYQLRKRLAYRGELRAVGDVQRDQLFYLSRSGFDAFLIKEGHDAQAALASLHDFAATYQSAADGRLPRFRAAAPDREAIGG